MNVYPNQDAQINSMNTYPNQDYLNIIGGTTAEPLRPGANNAYMSDRHDLQHELNEYR